MADRKKADRSKTDRTDRNKTGLNPENEHHNLDARLESQDRRPVRDVGEADFAAEAHGFTGAEKAGRGSTYDGTSRPAAAAHEFVTRKGDGEPGPEGEWRLAGTDRCALRLWKGHTAHGKSMRKRPYDLCGFVVDGTVMLVLEDTQIELNAGDSFVVPADTSHSFRIATPATVIEATTPPARDEID